MKREIERYLLCVGAVLCLTVILCGCALAGARMAEMMG